MLLWSSLQIYKESHKSVQLSKAVVGFPLQDTTNSKVGHFYLEKEKIATEHVQSIYLNIIIKVHKIMIHFYLYYSQTKFTIIIIFIYFTMTWVQCRSPCEHTLGTYFLGWGWVKERNFYKLPFSNTSGLLSAVEMKRNPGGWPQVRRQAAHVLIVVVVSLRFAKLPAKISSCSLSKSAWL